MLERTAQGSFSITREWLNECFTGAPDARLLNLSASGDTARTAARERLLEKLRLYFPASTSELIQRDALKQLGEQAAIFPVVFLIGHGGCGKTILAVQYLLEESTRRLVMMLAAPDATQDECLGRELRELRSREHSHRVPVDSMGVVIDRLCVANEDAEPPFLVIDVDGLDEVSESAKSGVRQVIDRFWGRANVPAQGRPCVDLSGPLPGYDARGAEANLRLAQRRVSRGRRGQGGSSSYR